MRNCFTSRTSLYQPHPFLKTPLCVAVALTFPSLSTNVFAAGQSVIEEMVVTAQKREQSMQDVSVAVSAFSGEAIEKMGFEEGLDITAQVPNMNFFAIFGEASSPSVSLRGISLVNFSDSWESPVSIYVDDVYRGNPAGSAIQLFDLERVEVLRGPQGTLYGRNTTGGLVHYVSKKPTDSFEARASLSYGSYNEVIAEGAISGPITSTVGGRLAVKRTHNDGWQTTTLPKAPGAAASDPFPESSKKLNDSNSLGWRALLDIELGANANVLLNVHGSDADQQSVGFAHMGYLESPEVGAAVCSINRIHSGLCYSPDFGNSGDEFTNGEYGPENVATSTPNGLTTQIDTFGSSATFTYAWGDINFTSITAYEELDKFLQDDGDGTPVVFFDEQYSVDAEQITQEFRLDGTAGDTTWVAGMYYYLDDRGLVTQAPTTENGLWHEEIVTLDSESWALFGQVEYDFNTQLTLVAGLRYTDEERDFTQTSGPSFYDPVVTDVVDDLSESATTGRIGLDWRPNSRTLIYANYSTGFKSGGFSGSYNSTFFATAPVEAEEIDNREVGIKTTFDNGFRLNAAAFDYTVEGYQAQIFLTVADGSVITNAGDVDGRGAEIELTMPITDSFEVIAGAGVLDTEFDSQQSIGVTGVNYSLDGNELPSAPGLTYNFVARYYLSLGQSGEVTLQGDYSWQDDHYLQIENDPYSKHEAYGIANAKVSWHSGSGDYSVDVFANNVFDEEYFTYQNTLGNDWGYGVWGKPRTMGVRVNWNGI